MKARKIFTAAVAGTLAAAQVAMPVMADGGSFDVDVTTKTGVLRVQVPTSMAIAVDQFEISHTGNQIAAGEFEMQNFSEMDVKVTVTSTATLGSGISLVSTAQTAESSTGDEAWLGTAAMTNDGTANSGKQYDDLATGTDATPQVEEYWDLTDANSNVTSFDATTKKAEQTFYLAKGAGNAEYKLALPDVTGYEEKSFAKYYELTELATAPTNDATLQTAVNAGDVYAVATANKGKNEEAVTKIAKDSNVDGTTIKYESANTYYTAADNASAPATGSSKVYVYAAMQTGGGEAGFTYIGKLSGGKETWTSDDISKINISYTISGVTGTNYEAVADDCTYGFYKAAPATTVAGTKITNGSGGQEFSTSAALAARLQSGTVVFQFDTTANDVSSLSVTRIVVDDVEYTFTASNNSNTIATSDGKLYKLTGFTASTAAKIQVYYGNDIVVEYTLR